MKSDKTCFKCGVVKPLHQFYPHREMADGHLNKCKECTKKDTAQRISIVSRIPEWVALERERCRLKSKQGRALHGYKQSRASQAKWRERFPEKRKAHHVANNALRDGKIKRKTACERCGITGVRLNKHHHDYSKPLDVLWLCPACHGRQHWKPILQAT